MFKTPLDTDALVNSPSLPPRRLHRRPILLFAGHTADVQARSGVQRVTVNLARALSGVADVDLVKWDTTEGQLAYLDGREIDALFRYESDTKWPRTVNRFANRANDRFAAKLEPHARRWLIFPEIPYHYRQGNDTFARIVSQCREFNTRIASVFYDLIPIHNEFYAEHRAHHLRYCVELARCDLILPISVHSADALRGFFCDGTSNPSPLLDRIRPVPLPEGPLKPVVSEDVRDMILMVGTVEPRKRQVEVLSALAKLADVEEKVRRLKVMVIGSLHPASETAFRQLLERMSRVSYKGYASEAFIEECYRRAVFTVFASNDEGFGLPIAESLARGIPCLTANFGAMAEVAAAGGCLSVDVNDPDALLEGLRRMACEASLRDRLVAEIGLRRFRTWKDYADEIVAVLDETDLATRGIATRVTTLGSSDVSPPVGSGAPGEVPPHGVIVPARVGPWVAVPEAERASLYEADALAFEDRDTYEAWIGQAKHDAPETILPTRIVVGQPGVAPVEVLSAELAALARSRALRRRVADDEALAGQLACRWRGETKQDDALLRIVISTYNRGPFVAENVRWLLRHVGRFRGQVKIVVVDNASTDDTWTRLRRFESNGLVELHRNPTNVGMLGNLRVCSVLGGSRHVWLTGDDDFIVPRALDRVVSTLRDEPALPFAFVNFGVYFRESLAPGDSADGLIAEQHPLAASPSPVGMYRVREIAAEHDNLFTAVYPIIFRADILAACFDHRFDGVPFADLTESVPTTRIILERYAECRAWWLDEIGIVGNAHNSWAAHRPRWHAVLMPRVFELAREAGVDRRKLFGWSQSHLALLDDALRIAGERDIAIQIDEPEDLEVSQRIFRTRIAVPPGIRRRPPLSSAGRTSRA